MKSILWTFVAVVAAVATGCDAKTQTKQYIVDDLLLPLPSNGNFDYDLDGDGQPDNQLGLLLSSVSGLAGAFGLQLDLQGPFADGVKQGGTVLLFGETSTDAAFRSDSSATTYLYGGTVVNTPPRFDGSDHFTRIPHDPGIQFVGQIRNGQFSSAPSATMTSDVEIILNEPPIGLPGAGPSHMVPVHGAHLQYSYDHGKLTHGQFNGAIRVADLESIVFPTLLNLIQNGLKNAQYAPTLLRIFDTGGTTTDQPPSCACAACACSTNGTCARASDGQIDLCEIATNPAIKAALKPDVQLFSADGKMYKPTPGPKKVPDSISLGIGFTAVGATF